MSTPDFTLHTFFKSSAAARIRIALNLKKIPFTPIYVDLFKDEQKTDAYRLLNPSGTVPLLVHYSPSREPLVSSGQSIAALEYIEEATASVPGNIPLLPPMSDLRGRAFVRELVTLCVADIQPVTSLRMRKAVTAHGIDAGKWSVEWTDRGLKAYEGSLVKFHGEEKEVDFSFGDGPTLADCCLVPVVWNAIGNGNDIGQYPRVKRVFERMIGLEAVKAASYEVQGDYPEKK